jgi:hypothetical protein
MTFVKKRSNFLNYDPDPNGWQTIYDSLIKPIMQNQSLDIGETPREKMSLTEMEEYVGELFALAIYAKDNKVDNWVSRPKIGNQTPDFVINDKKEILEIYSPEKSNIEDFIQRDELQKRIKGHVQYKTDKYISMSLTIIVHVFVGIEVPTYLEALKLIALPNNHKILFYHGDKQYII